MIGPDFKVGIYDYNEDVKEIRLITLFTWVKAIKLEMNTGLKHSSGSVITLARKFLGAPVSYPTDQLYDHLKTSLDDIHTQLGV